MPPQEPSPYPGAVLNRTHDQPENNSSQDIDSGYGSVSTVSSTDCLGSPHQQFKTKLKIYDREIDSAHHRRFNDLKELLDNPLYDYLSKGKVNIGVISLKLRVLGKDEAQAKPWIIVFCDEKISRRARRFFDQKHIKELCRGGSSPPDMPSFEVLVCGRRPILKTREGMTTVIGTAMSSDVASLDTFCGLPILYEVAGKDCFGTLGGLVEIGNHHGEHRLYGLTAAHNFTLTQNEVSEHQPLAHVSMDVDFSVSMTADGGQSDLSSEEDLELEPSSEQYVFLDEEADRIPKAIGQDIKGKLSTFNLGHLSSINSAEAKNLDWALIELTIPVPDTLRPNTFFKDNSLCAVQGIGHLSARDIGEPLERVNVSLLSSNGQKSGQLSRTSDAVIVAPGTSFTEVYTLVLSNGAVLDDGDSGAWVVDFASHCVYGQVAASDILGDVYVFPIRSIFRQIERSLQGSYVSLPQMRTLGSQNRINSGLNLSESSQTRMPPPSNNVPTFIPSSPSSASWNSFSASLDDINPRSQQHHLATQGGEPQEATRSESLFGWPIPPSSISSYTTDSGYSSMSYSKSPPHPYHLPIARSSQQSLGSSLNSIPPRHPPPLPPRQPRPLPPLPPLAPRWPDALMLPSNRHMQDPRRKVQSLSVPVRNGDLLLCACCPKKPKKFDCIEDLWIHEFEKSYPCQFCNNRFKNKNEAERHQNSLHLQRYSWSCTAITNYEAIFYPSTATAAQTYSSPASDVCGYCGQEFPNFPQRDWEQRFDHLTIVHKFGECNQSKKFYRADHFRQHLKHSHAGVNGKWTNMLENTCMQEAPSTHTRLQDLSIGSEEDVTAPGGGNNQGLVETQASHPVFGSHKVRPTGQESESESESMNRQLEAKPA